MNEYFYWEKTLPKYLKDDIEALVKGYKENPMILDCLYNEVQGSINLAYYSNEITVEQADYLRKKYLWNEDKHEYRFY